MKAFPVLLPFLFIPLFFSCSNPLTEKSPAPQPYSYISAKSTGKPVPESPDPLVDWRWDNPQAADLLEVYTLKPISVTTDQPDAFDRLNSLTGNSPGVRVKGTGSIMLDFGQVNAAWLEFDSDDLNGTVEMSISEYNEPSILNEGAQNRIKTMQPVRYGNTFRLELNDQLYEGVRYGWIHIRTFENSWHIKNVRLVCQTKPVNYLGSFRCSDSLLTRIWYTGAYGVRLNLLNDHFGAILMERSDRHSWTGDAHPSQAAALVAFGNYDFVRDNIHHTSTQNNGILSYSLYWILSLFDYINYTGDSATLLRYIDNACEKLDNAWLHFGTDPRLRFYGWDERLGAGFENHSCRESQNAYKMLTIRSWIDFGKMMHWLGREELAEKYLGYAREKLSGLRIDCDWHSNFGIHAAADAINTGTLEPEEQDLLIGKKFSDRVNRLSYSPFNQYFIIQALARGGRYDKAIETIRDCWGGQINYGGTTFFEVFRPSWNQVLGTNDAPPNNQCGYTSLAHPWGGGVTKWLSEEVLGIKPAAPGFRHVEIRPNLGSLLTSVAGSVPTPHGEINARFDIPAGVAEVEIPAGIQATVGIPKAGKEILSIRLNGKPVWPGHSGLNPAAVEESRFIIFDGIRSGKHRFTIEYSGQTPPYEESPWVYPAVFCGTDTITGGNWGGSFGSEGYVLCNYYPGSDQSGDLRTLPGYVTGVTYNLQGQIDWETGVASKAAPAPGPENGFPRNATAICTRDPLACKQTMTVDIEMNQPRECRISLYFLDYDNSNRRTAVEVFDMETMEIIAPVKIVSDYSGGRYLTYSYDKSVRFRINQVRGPNAVLSGIFFD
jgi:alpha-L-rhamnosidase